MPTKTTKRGRPTKMDKTVLGKLEQAFRIGCTDREACAYAQIHPSTLYEYQNKFPEFSDQKENFKLNPILKAKATIMKNLNKPKVAQWLLERKAASDYNLRHIHVEYHQDEPFWTDEERGNIERLLDHFADLGMGQHTEELSPTKEST